MENKSQVGASDAQRKSNRLLIAVILLAVIAIAAVLTAAWPYVEKLMGDKPAGVDTTKVDSLPAITEPVDDQPCGDYPFTAQRKVTYDDLVGMSADELRIMRNEIHARHGYTFDDVELLEHFMNKEWYFPSVTKVELSDIESYNAAFIRQYEQSLLTPHGKYPFTSKRKVTFDDIYEMGRGIGYDSDDFYEKISFELRVMRNEIYARHGYIFSDKEMQEYFKAQDWYHPITKNVQLSDIEQYNASFIKEHGFSCFAG